MKEPAVSNPNSTPEQSEGRKENAARPVTGAPDASPDRYPNVREGRAFEPKVGDKLGPAADPAEGKR